MKVSVLIPVYQVREYIAHCARTLFAQTYADIEYVFVDDASPDDSIHLMEEVLKEFPMRQEQVVVVRHVRNTGVGITRQDALDHATADYVLFVDSDDSLPSNAVELLVTKVQQTGADMVTGSYVEVYADKQEIACPPVRDSKDVYLKKLLCQNIVKHQLWARLYKKSLFVDNGISFVEGINYGEDYSVFPRLLYFAKTATIDEVVYYYRMDNSSSYTHTPSYKNIISNFKACAVITSFFQHAVKYSVYQKALEIGMVNVWRTATKNQMDFSEVNQTGSFMPTGRLPRLLVLGFKSAIPYAIMNCFYLLYRRLYVLRLKN